MNPKNLEPKFTNNAHLINQLFHYKKSKIKEKVFLLLLYSRKLIFLTLYKVSNKKIEQLFKN